MNLNSSPSPFPIEEISENHDDHQTQPNLGVASSSSSASCHFFFNSIQDQAGYYHQQVYNPQYHQQQDDDRYSFHGGSSSYEIKNKVESGLKLTLWRKEDHGLESTVTEQNNNNNNPMKWMSSKMRLMQKMNKNPDRVSLKIITSSAATTKVENDHHHKPQQPTSSMETELSSNSTSYNNNSPIRVCADCNTTKTPLWRSGPKGPKSLCNACGIRQRKARRAMAAAAAAANGTVIPADQPPALRIKVKRKEKIGKNGHASHLKKRCKMSTETVAASGSPSDGQKKVGFEDFLINLSKNLAFHRVFPDDEKDAAILLMALSSGLVHG